MLRSDLQVADFGLAKFASDNNTHVSTRVMGTFGYAHFCFCFYPGLVYIKWLIPSKDSFSRRLGSCIMCQSLSGICSAINIFVAIWILTVQWLKIFFFGYSPAQLQIV